ncbi:sensor domain-containing diguanylate cyclase [Shimia marina]|uniref:diguanylate cyclase n=1 Tax=Shimia marina TaxID=321267 RepID=A0A0P1FAE7_9RHOB|nr:diguanylate cyclase [Shimia marina]CUH52999.1 putative diguanylate cyclase YcdT [Shimia marina]SFD92073.1 diguanylate cyclase (GGDEF) domain-containing protein [Shimia marina]
MRRFAKLTFTLLFGLSGLAVAIFGVLQISLPIVERLMESDIRKHSELWHRRVILHLEDPDNSFIAGGLTSEDISYLQLLPEASDVYRFKLYNSSGTVIWSTRPEDIGYLDIEHFPKEALQNGITSYHREQKPASEIDGLVLHALSEDVSTHEVAEIFEPVISGGAVIGAMEFYTDITDVRKTFLLRVRVLLFALTALAIATVGVVAVLLFRSNRRQYRALTRRSAKEKDLLNEQLKLARNVKLLGELNEWLQSSRSLDELFDMVKRFMTHLLPDSEGSIYVYSNSRDVLDGWASWNGGNHKDHIHPDECWGLRRGRTYEYGDSEINFTCSHAEPHNDHPYFCFPILAHGETVGLLHLRAKSKDAEIFHANRDLAQMCSEQISMAIANVRMRDELHDQSVRDPLTGLFNRRHMTETLRKAINDSQRSTDPFSVIAIDVDHFKKFNDTHGHDAGDMVLRAVGSVLQQDCDGDEVACRPGGEEFTVILPNCDRETAQERAEGLRSAVENIKVRYGEKTLPRVTISVGLAIFPEHGTLPQMLLRSADDALYQAKALGRNRVVLSDTLENGEAPGELWALPDARDQDAPDTAKDSDTTAAEPLTKKAG